MNDLDIDQEEPIDVFDIIDRLGLWLVFNRLDSLLGATLPKGTGGIMLTTQRGPSVQRYTAAHEIGHWILDFNEPAFDTDDDIFHPTADREQLAQLFAGQLLMPPPLVFETGARHGISSDASATAPAVYLTARDMGASYEAAVRQLSNLDIISPSTRDGLLARTPMQIKTELCHGHRPRGPVDVWPVDLGASGGEVALTEGDEVVLTLPENRTTGYRWMTPDEITERSTREDSPPPEPFAFDFSATGAARPARGEARRSRSTAAVNRALMRVPGNTAARRLLHDHGGSGHPATFDARNLDAADGIEERDRGGDDRPEIGEARSALEVTPASLGEVDDRFTAGWAQVPPSRVRAVRRAIAGRRDLALPESLNGHLEEAAGSWTALDPSTIPAAATGERLVALRSTGEGSLGLDLTYSLPFDPHAPAAATFHLEVRVSPTPQEEHRRTFLQWALAQPDDLGDRDDPGNDGAGGRGGDRGDRR
ncbi:ImmA/IrrE family metallo-endopeptidase [Aeromicrobium endophyticum]|uniref:ImmA/IrrE family metallo-endopeptidase n=1 Tax=Aeromicrobium endophyticum TaxID=2292704 RepID=UPI001313EE3D|nr:ImmA/IrrE family metallo-endopeptidase [Aeromicrobium endophyticum]